MPRKYRPLAIIFSASVLVAVAGIVYWLFEPDDPRYVEDRALKEAIESAIHAAGPRGSFDLGAVVAFPWDRVYELGAYSGPEVFEERAGFAWPGLRRSASVFQDRYQLIAFVKGREVRWFDHDVVLGRIEIGDDPIDPGDSVLDVTTVPERGVVVTRHGVAPRVLKLVHYENGRVVEVDAAELQIEQTLELRGAVGTTATKTFQVVAEASGRLWFETRAAVRRGSGTDILGGENVKVARTDRTSTSTGIVVDLGPVTERERVELTVEVALPSALRPGTYETQLNWCVAPSGPTRIDAHPTLMRIEVFP